MTIRTMSEEEFTTVLNRFLSPSRPIRQRELLRGRQSQLTAIKRALASPGRNIFVYGDRGVGKTSVAQTSSLIYQSADSDPVWVSCDSDSTFYSVCENIASRLLGASPIKRRKEKTSKFTAGVKWLSVELQTKIGDGIIETPESISEAVGLIVFCGDCHSESPIVVIDEFERIDSEKDRSLFGDFIKQLGDQECRVKFIFCGTGNTIEDLLAHHASCFRYLANIELERLRYEARFEIIKSLADELAVDIDVNYLYRLADISDGFPHYLHLIGEKIFWEAFEDEYYQGYITAEYFSKATHRAVQEVSTELKHSYTKATEKYLDDYQHVLWAVAAHPDLRRRNADIFASYCKIMEQMELEPIEKTAFNNRLNALKTKAHGSVLVGTRQGWYHFREPIVRGYCRLRAAIKGIHLGREHHLEA